MCVRRRNRIDSSVILSFVAPVRTFEYRRIPLLLRFYVYLKGNTNIVVTVRILEQKIPFVLFY